MDVTLQPRPISGSISAIASKSQAHRLLICAALSNCPTNIVCAELSQDIEASARCLTALGAELHYADSAFTVHPIELPQGENVLDVGESGSTLRFLLPVAAALGVRATFRLHGRLPERPLSPLWEELEAHGCRLSRPTPDTLLCEGRLHGGQYYLPGNISSQFISGLLFALPLTGEASEIHLTSSAESLSYIHMTLAALRSFGVAVKETADGWQIPAEQHFSSIGSAFVEGDWSNAAFWLCAGAISKSVSCTGLSPDSPQGDRKILECLRNFGAQITWENGTVTVSPASLHGIEIDARDIPDLVPPLALVAATAEGTTRIFGAERLRIKESDRLQSVADTLNSLGGHVEVMPDGLLIRGGHLRGGTIQSQNDHRIAMLGAIAASVCTESVTICGSEAVNKSYPRFWADLRQMQR